MYQFFVQYFLWHYSQALLGYIRVSKNFWWFFVQFFSLRELMGSFFAPFKRIEEVAPRIWDFENWMASIMINIMSRIIGVLIRLMLIVVGILTLTIYTMVACIGYFLWLGAPVIIISCYLFGITLLFI